MLQVVPSLVSGGVERGTVDLAGALVAAGWTAYVASAGGPMEHQLTRVGAHHLTLPLASKNPLVMRRNAAALSEIIRRHKIDIVHARSRAPAWSALAGGARDATAVRHHLSQRLRHRAAAEALVQFGDGERRAGHRDLAIRRRACGRASMGSAPTACGSFRAASTSAQFDPGRVRGERVAALAEQWRVPEDAKVVMLPGRLTRWKGGLDFIEAIARLGRRDLCCLFVGAEQRAGFRRELEATIERLGLVGLFRIVEDCRDMPAAYMLSDVVVSASTDPEGFGRVIIEAQAMGRPVVATDHGGARETIQPGVTGWLAQPSDPGGAGQCDRRARWRWDRPNAAPSRAAPERMSRRATPARRCAARRSTCTRNCCSPSQPPPGLPSSTVSRCR